MTAGQITLHRLNQSGLLVFSGADAQSFLQGQLTCDVEGLATGRSTYGAYCTPKGRILANFLLWRTGVDYLMQLPAPLCAPLQKRLSMYILRSKVKAIDATGSYRRLGLAGRGAVGIIENVFGDVPGGVHDVTQAGDATLIQIGIDRYEIVATNEPGAALEEALKRHAKEGVEPSWQWLDIRDGIPWITPATQEQFVPQMVNLDLIDGVSFSKGCYPGQEIVARAHYRGQVRQRMYRVHIATDARVEPGDKLYSADMGGQSSGMIVNAARAPEGGCDALAVIHTSSADTGDVCWKSFDGPRLAFLPLPYASR